MRAKILINDHHKTRPTMRQKKSFLTTTLLPILILIGLIFAVKYAKSWFSATSSGQTEQTSQPQESTSPRANGENKGIKLSKTTGVPDAALKTLEYVLKNGEAPPGVTGGRTFLNREKQLVKTTPDGKKITYQEWDVHKKVQGKNRGAERLITGSDGSAYYTSDHYKSFKKIQ
jgi:guanyl-specific ribonuclease Sa